MARPERNTVEYIPLDCQFTDSIQAVENLFGNDGFVVWVKLLQKLGRTENYIIDVRNPTKWSLFYSLFRLNENKVLEILNFLAELECIDKDLWAKKIIYSKNLVKRIAGVYKKRKYQLKNINAILEEIGVLTSENLVSGDGNSINSSGNTQSKVKESKVKESKYPPSPPYIEEDKKNLEEEEEKIILSNEEEEILKNYAYSADRTIYDYASWRKKVIENGNYKSIIEATLKERKQQKEEYLTRPECQKYIPPEEINLTPEEKQKIKEIQASIKQKIKKAL